MRVVITGAAGFLGSHLVDHYIRRGDEVVGIDNYVTGRSGNLEHLEDVPAFTPVEADVSLYIEVSGPDLVLLSHRGFDLKGAVGKGVLHNREIFTGMHTQDDAFLYVRGEKLTEEKPHIMDLAPTILALMGVEVPDDMDGRVLVGT